MASNALSVRINQDDGKSFCIFIGCTGYLPAAVSGQPAPNMQQTSQQTFKIKGTDYDNYVAASTSPAARYQFAATYIASNYPTPLTLGAVME